MDGILSIEEGEHSKPEVQLDCEAFPVGEKRPVEIEVEGDLDEWPSKRSRIGPRTNAALKRVAEIVLVLSTMSKIRGGKKPTEAETGLMVEARAELVELCESLAPKDIVSREAIGVIIDDCGLNGKVKDQRLGFSGPKLTIAERILQNKKKMEESRKYTPQSFGYVSHSLQTSLNTATENRGSSNTLRMIPSEKPIHASLFSGSISAPLPPGHVSATAPKTIHYQLAINDAKASTVSSRLPSGHLARDSSSSELPRVERRQFKLDGGPNGSICASQGKVHSSPNRQLSHAPTCSIQTQSATSGPEQNKLPNYISIKVDGAAEMGMSQGTPVAPRDQSFRPFISQTAPGNLASVHQPLPATNYVQAPSLSNNHSEIAKVVQKFLQPKLPDHPTWIPPSRDYMSKALTCQLCQLTINEVDIVLICDACEKGYHIKCLQSMNQRSIPRGEWHCSRCLALSNGKPLPPKYGHVMRSNTPSKNFSSTANVPSPLEKKVVTIDSDVNQQKIIANGSLSIQSSAHTGGERGNKVGSKSDSLNPNTGEMQTNNFSSLPNAGEMQTYNFLLNPNAGDMQTNGVSTTCNIDEKSFIECCPNTSVNSMGEISHPHGTSSSERSSQNTKNLESSTCKEEFFELKTIHLTNTSEAVTNKDYYLQLPRVTLVSDQCRLTNSTEVPSVKFQDKHSKSDMGKVPSKSHLGENTGGILQYDIKHDEQDDAHKNTAASSATSIVVTEHSGHSFDGLHDVEWIGDIIKDVDGKKFYQSCFVDGVAYKLQDHALFWSNHGKLAPSKLQCIWEDCKTGLKWVIVNRCYFPGDLSENVGRPSPPESNEVYDSNHNSTAMAGLIQGPCEVLHPTKFKEESERRSQSEHEHNSGLQPMFLCKWFYDEVKGSFQPVYS